MIHFLLIYLSIYFVVYVGAIELFILSKYYKIQVAAVDIQTGRVDIYGQGENYQEVIKDPLAS